MRHVETMRRGDERVCISLFLGNDMASRINQIKKSLLRISLLVGIRYQEEAEENADEKREVRTRRSSRTAALVHSSMQL